MPELRSALPVLRSAARAWSEDKVPMMGAALAFYTAFSIAPLLVISIGVVGMVFGETGGAGVFETVRGLVGDQGARAVQTMVEGVSRKPRTGAVAAALGVLTLLIGASGVFGQLQESLNVIWRVALKPGAGWGVTLRRRLLSFGMVGVIAFLLLVSLVVSAGLTAAGSLLKGALPGGEAVWQAVNALVSFGVISALFAMIFKVLPDVALPWRVAWIGGAWTSALFTLGKLGIGLYLGKSGVASTYGAAGSVIVLLLWVYYSSQIVLFGAELTRAYVERSGRRVPAKESAVPTMTVFSEAVLAERRVREAPPPRGGALWYVAGAVGLLAGARLAFKRRQGALGAAETGLALLALLLARRSREGEARPSILRRVAARIPFKVKAAALAGALKGGGAEAARELRKKLSR